MFSLLRIPTEDVNFESRSCSRLSLRYNTMSYQGYQHGPHGFGGSSRNLTGGGSSQQSDLVNTTQPSTHNDHLSAYSPHQSYPDPRLQPSFADTQPPGSGNASVYMLIVEQTFSGDPPPPSTHRVEFNNTDWNAGRVSHGVPVC